MRSRWTRPARTLRFTAWFVGQVLTSSWTVLSDVISPGHRSTPRVVRLALRTESDLLIAALGMLITLTPGTLTLGVVRDAQGRRELLVHSMYHPDAAAAVRDLVEMEDRLLAAVTESAAGPSAAEEAER